MKIETAHLQGIKYLLHYINFIFKSTILAKILPFILISSPPPPPPVLILTTF